MAARLGPVLALVLAALLGAACGNGSNGTASPQRLPGTDKPLGQAAPVLKSSIYDVPVLPGAELDASRTGPGREVYRVPGTDPGSVYTFYSQRMPAESQYNGLEWCGEVQSQTIPRSYELAWQAPGTSDYLVIRVTNYETGSYITIFDDKSNAAREC